MFFRRKVQLLLMQSDESHVACLALFYCISSKNVTMTATPGSKAWLLRWLSLVLLVVQNALQALLIRYSKTRPNRVPFLMTSIVFFSESLKFVICIGLVILENGSVWRGFGEVYRGTVENLKDTTIVAGLSVLYTLQNILIIVSASNLNPAVFQVSYQIKIFTTAIFFVMILKRKLSRCQWFALFLLFVGISMVQVNEKLDTHPSPPVNVTSNHVSGTVAKSTDNYLLAYLQVLVVLLNSVTCLSLFKLYPVSAVISAPTAMSEHKKLNSFPHYTVVSMAVPDAFQCFERSSPCFAGMVSVLGATMLSGFSGVYLEKMLKSSNLSLWMRNIQLSFTGLPISLISMLIEDYERVRLNVFRDYDFLVWTIVLFFAIGGLLVAATIKFADNIQKGFATSISIIITSFAAVFFFDFRLTALFSLGTFFVLSAVFVFAKFPPKS
ncbi:unnamed protein product [Soboliphyme baturini]|uniref:UDP-galactose transporter n=1 Tax=Soboliphyme baturini TaxID=241478 RepID=A0A183ICR7_9BILA|nr:unnamed protein product [Soboliphyme baturini]